MAFVAASVFDPAHTPGAHAAQVLGVTARAWQLAPRSAQALARRAAPGYVPRRARLRAAAALALRPAAVGFALSW